MLRKMIVKQVRRIHSVLVQGVQSRPAIGQNLSSYELTSGLVSEERILAKLTQTFCRQQGAQESKKGLRLMSCHRWNFNCSRLEMHYLMLELRQMHSNRMIVDYSQIG